MPSALAVLKLPGPGHCRVYEKNEIFIPETIAEKMDGIGNTVWGALIENELGRSEFL